MSELIEWLSLVPWNPSTEDVSTKLTLALAVKALAAETIAEAREHSAEWEPSIQNVELSTRKLSLAGETIGDVVYYVYSK